MFESAGKLFKNKFINISKLKSQKNHFSHNMDFFSDNVILGGGPVGSSLARQLSLANKQVTLFHNETDFGSHNDKSRLIRPAFDSTVDEYKLSLESIRELIQMDKNTNKKFISSHPGVLIIASPYTPLYKKMMLSQFYNTDLRLITVDELKRLFPEYKFNFPSDTALWFHPSGYVVNPKVFSEYNLDVAKSHNCNIINKPALFQFHDEKFKVTAEGNQVQYFTNNLYLLAGANNKSILKNSNFYSQEFENTYLTAISTIRYFSPENQKHNLMPITVGQLKFSHYSDILDFSTMPEGEGIIKTRLSGFGKSEIIEYITDKDVLPENQSKQISNHLFTSIFPNIGQQIDFNRCVTYRNSLPHYHALSPLKLKYKDSVVYTTPGCYGVHVRYANAIATAIVNDKNSTKQCSAVNMNEIRFMPDNFTSNKVNPQLIEILKDSEGFKKIGRTPIIKIGDKLFMKIEGYNLTGSIKDRPALYVLLKKIDEGKIKNNDTVVIATSGNYGMSIFKVIEIIKEKLKINLNLIIVTPESYRSRPIFSSLEELGVIGLLQDNFSDQSFSMPNLLIYTKGIFTESMAFAKSLCQYDSSIIYLDQHYDDTHANSHFSTAEEICSQVPEATDIVMATGSGATATGIYRFFKDKKVNIHSRGSENGKIPGTSDSKIYQNYFNEAEGLQYHPGFFNPVDATNKQALIKTTHGIDVGLSTGAALTLADDVRNNNPDAVIVVISPSFK